MTCYSLDFRKKIIEGHKEGYSVRKIAQMFRISPSTVQKLITKYSLFLDQVVLALS